MTVRELPIAEWEKLRDFPPFDIAGIPSSDEHFKILVAEVDGRIIGLCGLSTQIHWDPWFIDPTHQGKSGVFRALVAEGLGILRAVGAAGVHTTVPLDRPDLVDLVQRFGFIDAPGKLFLLNVADVKDY